MSRSCRFLLFLPHKYQVSLSSVEYLSIEYWTPKWMRQIYSIHVLIVIIAKIKTPPSNENEAIEPSNWEVCYQVIWGPSYSQTNLPGVFITESLSIVLPSLQCQNNGVKTQAVEYKMGCVVHDIPRMHENILVSGFHYIMWPQMGNIYACTTSHF